MRADTLGDIAAMLALYRPGPMASVSAPTSERQDTAASRCTPIHPELAGWPDEFWATPTG